MSKFNELSLCSILHIDWESKNGTSYKAILMTPIAGKIPNKRLLYAPFLTGMETAISGEYYLMNCFEIKPEEKLGRQFRWIVIDKIQHTDLLPLVKELGLPTIINTENMASAYSGENWLEKEKLRFETETQHFKAKAHIRHLQKRAEASDTPMENNDSEFKGYDEHDVYTAFDGDIDSMNEFLGNH
jgi:hypothetical protein